MISRMRLATTLAPLTVIALAGFTQVSTPGARAPREAFASVPGARIFYVDTGGEGVPVVFLHAAIGTTSAWQYQIPAFAAVGYRAIAYDRRGWGRTVVDPKGELSKKTKEGTRRRVARSVEGTGLRLGLTSPRDVGTMTTWNELPLALAN